MALKLQDFARADVSTENVTTKEEHNNESTEDIVYDAPRSRNVDETSMPRRYNDVPRFRDEKPWFGPMDFDGNVQVKYPTMIDGYENDNKYLYKMESMGLPTGFNLNMKNLDCQEKQRKGDKKTFYCEMCLIELNSLDTMTSHVRGVKHMKKQLASEEENDKRYKRGEISREEREYKSRTVKVIPIPNPVPTKKKVPVRLHEKIKETRDPVVGLDFIREWIAVSDPEMEPHYECQLCGNQGIANGMFSHLLGYKHRQQVALEMYKDDSTRVMDMSQNDLLKFASDCSENNDNLSQKIRTRRSDEEYPWPPGKAPWALGRGGSGIPPDGARENWGKNTHFQKEDKPVVVQVVKKKEVDKTAFLPSISTLKTPINDEDAVRMIEMGEMMFMLGIDYLGTKLKKQEKDILQTCLNAVVLKIKQKKGNVTLLATTSDQLGSKQSSPPTVSKDRNCPTDEVMRPDSRNRTYKNIEESDRTKESSPPSIRQRNSFNGEAIQSDNRNMAYERIEESRKRRSKEPSPASKSLRNSPSNFRRKEEVTGSDRNFKNLDEEGEGSRDILLSDFSKKRRLEDGELSSSSGSDNGRVYSRYRGGSDYSRKEMDSRAKEHSTSIDTLNEGDSEVKRERRNTSYDALGSIKNYNDYRQEVGSR